MARKKNAARFSLMYDSSPATQPPLAQPSARRHDQVRHPLSSPSPLLGIARVAFLSTWLLVVRLEAELLDWLLSIREDEDVALHIELELPLIPVLGLIGGCLLAAAASPPPHVHVVVEAVKKQDGAATTLVPPRQLWLLDPPLLRQRQRLIDE